MIKKQQYFSRYSVDLLISTSKTWSQYVRRVFWMQIAPQQGERKQHYGVMIAYMGTFSVFINSETCKETIKGHFRDELQLYLSTILRCLFFPWVFPFYGTLYFYSTIIIHYFIPLYTFYNLNATFLMMNTSMYRYTNIMILRNIPS